MKKLDKKMKLVWSIGWGLVTLISIIVTIVVLLNAPSEDKEMFTKISSSILIPVDVILLLITIFYPSLKYKFYSYSYDEKTIRINKGIIFKNRIMIPVCQIQDLHFMQGPIMLILKLATLEISTAGSNYLINGLKVKDCETIIEDLREKLEERIEALNNEKI